MKKHLLLIISILCVMPAQAYDFEVNGLYYHNKSKGDQKIAQVAKGEYTGDIIIPSSITVSGETYAVTGMESWAFQDARITSVTIPDSFTSIEYCAFYNCKLLKSVSLPDKGITLIDGNAFYGCTSLASISISGTVNEIGSQAFDGCSSLKSITIPEGVTKIEYKTFANCISLTSVTLPNSLKKILWYAFNGSISLSSITIPQNVTDIDEVAFADCTKLAEINVVPENTSLSSLDGVLFNYNKTKLLRYPEGKTGKEYNIPNTVTNIAEWAFYKCISLSSIIIPEGVTTIGSAAISYCSSLHSIDLPNSLNYIAEHAFSNSKIRSIVIPKNVAYIGENAFYYNGLNEIEVHWETPIQLEGKLFYYTGTSISTILYVPAGTKSLYEEALYWQDFDIREGTITSIESNDAGTLENIYISGNTLYIDTPNAENIFIYGIKGELLYKFDKQAGKATFTLSNNDHKILIVKSSSGKTKKIII